MEKAVEGTNAFALIQDGSAWLISSGGKLVDQLPEGEAGQYGRITGCQLLAPSVGTTLALATEYAAQQSSLLDLLEALDGAGLTENVDAIRLDSLSDLKMDWYVSLIQGERYGAVVGRVNDEVGRNLLRVSSQCLTHQIGRAHV